MLTQRSRRAPGKINLGLHVLRRRPDGFHDIDTVMVAIGWHDVLLYAPAEEFSFTCTGPDLPLGEENLCVRAAHALAASERVTPVGRLHLEKRLPHGAGLGGGSSDAAHTLLLLNDTWKLDLPPSELHRLASDIGSDVPFFLHGGAMRATGRGEVLESITDYHFPFTLAVVMPEVQVSTADAYRLVTPRERVQADVASVVRSNDLERWRRELRNDFEPVIAERYPAIRDALDRLRLAGADYAAMTGSGAAVFGVFERPEAARAVAEEALAGGLMAWSGQALTYT